MSGFVTLIPSKRPTVAAVGEFAYKDALRKVPDGDLLLELVPEPDNPYDPWAISVRYGGDVIAYVPRGRTSSYWQVVARVAASGKTARVKGRVVANRAADFYEVSLYLLAGDNALGNVKGLVSKSSAYDVPDAYRSEAPPSGISTPTPGSGVTFTQAEVNAEIARRRRDNPTSTPNEKSTGQKKDNSNLGCGVVALIVLIIVLIAL